MRVADQETALRHSPPARRDRPIEISLPKIAAASDLVAAAAALTDAVAGGDITPNEASALSNLVGNTAKAIETFELSERLARLEEQVAVKGMAAVLAGGAASGPTTCQSFGNTTSCF